MTSEQYDPGRIIPAMRLDELEQLCTDSRAQATLPHSEPADEQQDGQCQVVTCDEPATGWGVCGEHLSLDDPEQETGCGCGDFAHGIVSTTCPAHGTAVTR